MMRGDDVLMMPAARRIEVLTGPGRRRWSAEAKAQAKILEDFWNSIRVVNAFDRNQRGGFALLVRQMMEAASSKHNL